MDINKLLCLSNQIKTTGLYLLPELPAFPSIQLTCVFCALPKVKSTFCLQLEEEGHHSDLLRPAGNTKAPRIRSPVVTLRLSW